MRLAFSLTPALSWRSLPLTPAAAATSPTPTPPTQPDQQPDQLPQKSSLDITLPDTVAKSRQKPQKTQKRACSGCIGKANTIKDLERKAEQLVTRHQKKIEAVKAEADRKVKNIKEDRQKVSKEAAYQQRRALKATEALVEARGVAASATREAKNATEKLAAEASFFARTMRVLERQLGVAQRATEGVFSKADYAAVVKQRMAAREGEAEMEANYVAQLELVSEARLRLKELESEEVADEEMECADEEEVSREEQLVAEWRARMGLEPGRNPPTTTFQGNASAPFARAKWCSRSIIHMAAVLQERGEGEDIDVVAAALDKLGYLERLVDAPTFQRVRKRLAQEVVQKQQAHWSARHGIHLWDRLGLSRASYESLRHLMSFVYDPVERKYNAIRVYEDPNDDKSFVAAATIASRERREKLFGELADAQGIVVGSNGRCERDAAKITARMYDEFAGAMRKDYSALRPAQPLMFLDGTGGALGRGVCHGEMGSADFIEDCKQSRSTLAPLSQSESSDHALPLRENMEFAFSTFNQMEHDKCIACDPSDDYPDGRIPARPSITADMQGVKSIVGKSLTSNSVWCKCKRNTSAHFDFGTGDCKVDAILVGWSHTWRD